MSKDTFYFSHDYNARSDEKIVKLLSLHGMAGYGVFWAIVENLYNNENRLELDYEKIAFQLHIDDKKIIESVINDFKLFKISEDNFSSKSVARRLKERDNKSEKARQSAFQRWNKEDANASKNDANAMRTQCDSNAIKERKGNKGNKGNKGKGEPENPSPSEPNFIDKIIEVYAEVFPDTVNAYSGKNKSAVGGLLKTWKDTHPDQNSEDTLNALRDFFERCKSIPNEWYKNNMSLSIIDSKFTEIGRILTNPKRKPHERPLVNESADFKDLGV